MKSDEGQPLRRVGRGRSAAVYVSEGGCTAHKVFTPDSTGRAVFYLLSGAPNPYGWNEQAVLTAVVRRRVLASLCRFWFGDRLTLPETYGWGWNECARAYEIRCEFIEGRHLPLRGPVDLPSDAWLADLTEGIMAPLQGHLEAAGLDGLAWQAGRGNPAAASNFVLRRSGAGAREGGASRFEPSWVWVDLESGLPAIFSSSPRELLGFYLPRCWKYGRPLFDDVDVPNLRRYIDARRDEIEKALGESSVAELRSAVEALDYHQLRWKAADLLEVGISAALALDHITAQEAAWYRAHPLRWLGHLAARGAAGGAAALGRRARSGIAWLSGLDLAGLWSTLGRFIISQRYRAALSRRYVERRIEAWRERGSLNAPLAALLARELEEDESSTYLADFGVHLAIKPFVKALQWWLVPALLLAGAIDEALAAVALIAGGAAARTLYTLGRMLPAALEGRRLPWIALGVGMLPVVGNAAYPAQLVACSVGGARLLARFILYDTFAAVGRAIPIWGGPDTLTEHRMNRLPDRLAAGWRTCRSLARARLGPSSAG